MNADFHSKRSRGAAAVVALRMRRSCNLGLVRSSHSLMRMIRIFEPRSRRLMALSRAAFRRSLQRQYSVLVRGTLPQRRQACQKQPSTNTARRMPSNQKSGAPSSLTCIFQPRILALINMPRSFFSVVRLPLDLIALMFARRDSVVWNSRLISQNLYRGARTAERCEIANPKWHE